MRQEGQEGRADFWTGSSWVFIFLHVTAVGRIRFFAAIFSCDCDDVHMMFSSWRILHLKFLHKDVFMKFHEQTLTQSHTYIHAWETFTFSICTLFHHIQGSHQDTHALALFALHLAAKISGSDAASILHCKVSVTVGGQPYLPMLNGSETFSIEKASGLFGKKSVPQRTHPHTETPHMRIIRYITHDIIMT